MFARVLQISFVLALAADLARIGTLILCRLNPGFASDCPSLFGVMSDANLAVPFYCLAAFLSLTLTSVNRGHTRQGVLLNVVGIALAITTLVTFDGIGFQATVPLWGLLPIWCLTTNTLSARARSSRVVCWKHVAFFLSCVLCLAIWGKHGDIDLMKIFCPDWQGLDAGAARIASNWIPLISWGDVALSLAAGFVAAVVIPCLFARWLLGLSMHQVGLGVPTHRRREMFGWTFIFLAVGLPIFFFAAGDPALQCHYPYVRQFNGVTDFMIYEVCTLLFYASVEFFFRGYVLFGAEKIATKYFGSDKRQVIMAVALVASAIPYIIWHVDKPSTEVLGALAWSVIAGISALRFRTVLHLILVHWIWNVWQDFWVLQDLGIRLGS